MKRIAYKTESNEAHLLQLVRDMQVGEVLQISEPTRSLDQNALLWSYLTAFSQHLEWPVMVNGKIEKTKMSNWDWKNFLTGAFEGEAGRMAVGMDGTGFVMLGAHTSKYGKKKFSEFVDFLDAFAAQHCVKIG